MLDFLAISVGIAHFFGGLLDKLRGHAVVLHLFSIGRHSVENAQSVRFICDRDVGDLILESFTGSVEQVNPLLAQLGRHCVAGRILRHLLPRDIDAVFSLYKLNDFYWRLVAGERLNDEGFNLCL